MGFNLAIQSMGVRGNELFNGSYVFFRINNQTDRLKFHTIVKTCIGRSVFIRTFAAENEQLSHAYRGEKIP